MRQSKFNLSIFSLCFPHNIALGLSLSIIVVLLALPGKTFASSGWSESSAIAEVNPTARHYYQFRLNDIESPAGCKQKNGFYQDYKDRGAEQMYSALLEALSANLNVKVFVTGGCNLKGFAEVSSIIISR